MNDIVGVHPPAVFRLEGDGPLRLRVQAVSGSDSFGPVKVALSKVDLAGGDRILDHDEVAAVECAPTPLSAQWVRSEAFTPAAGYYVYAVTHPAIPDDATVRVRAGLEEQPRALLCARESLFEGERAKERRLGLAGA